MIFHFKQGLITIDFWYEWFIIDLIGKGMKNME
jgi:hypothetical protein